ncbi:MAG: helix-hairpin-helix domain-containing protein [Phycisphaerae bacterium]
MTRSDQREYAPRAGLLALLGLAVASIAPLAASHDAAPNSAARAGSVTLRIDPNVASADDLMLLPGIGARTAEQIIARRAAGDHPFRALADLDAVPRIGPATLARLQGNLALPGRDSSDAEDRP